MITPGLNENYATKKFRFHLDTPLVYNQVYEFDFESKVLTKLQDAKLTGKEFRRDRYTCSRIYAPSKDGTNIPITLVHNKTMKKNRQNKMILHAYGSYGIFYLFLILVQEYLRMSRLTLFIYKLQREDGFQLMLMLEEVMKKDKLGINLQ